MMVDQNNETTNGAARPSGERISPVVCVAPADGAGAERGGVAANPPRPSRHEERRRDVLFVLDRVRAEVSRARGMFPTSSHLLAALTEEAGEVAAALLNGEGRDRVRTECIQVAAVAVRLATEGDADFAGYGVARGAAGGGGGVRDLFEGAMVAVEQAAEEGTDNPVTAGLEEAMRGADVGTPVVVNQPGHTAGQDVLVGGTLVGRLWELWPWMQSIRGRGPDVMREAARSSSEIARGLRRLEGRDGYSLRATALIAALLHSAGGGATELTGHVVRRGITAALNDDVVVEGRRMRLVASTDRQRIMWAWREVR